MRKLLFNKRLSIVEVFIGLLILRYVELGHYSAAIVIFVVGVVLNQIFKETEND